LETKTCKKCGISKPFDQFTKVKNPAKGDRNGLVSKCKPCRSAENNAYNQKRFSITQENNKRWYEENGERAKYRAKSWRESNKELHAANNKKWKTANKTKNAANASRYKAAKNKATPSWLGAIELAQIQEFYDVAACKTVQTGVLHHVDHIIPLNGEIARGLHVPWNLQILTAFENISKKNKLIGGDYASAW